MNGEVDEGGREGEGMSILTPESKVGKFGWKRYGLIKKTAKSKVRERVWEMERIIIRVEFCFQ